eukprot:94923-Prymnesium_polylepis.1
MVNNPMQSVAVIDQEADGPLSSCCRELGISTNCCGYVACAVASHVAKHATPHMTERALASLLADLRDPVVMMPRIEAVIAFVRHAREVRRTPRLHCASTHQSSRIPVAAQAYASSERFPDAVNRADFLQGIVRDPEVAVFLRSGLAEDAERPTGSVSMLRAVQLGASQRGLIRWGEAGSSLEELEHEDERAYTAEEAPFRTHYGADFFFEVVRDAAGGGAGGGEASALPPGALLSADGWHAAHGCRWRERPGGSAVLCNWWGHYGVYLPVVLTADSDTPPINGGDGGDGGDGDGGGDGGGVDGSGGTAEGVVGVAGVAGESASGEGTAGAGGSGAPGAGGAVGRAVPRECLLVLNSLPSAAAARDESPHASELLRRF